MADGTLGAIYSLQIERFGALGIKEVDHDLSGLARSDVDQWIERTLSTMTPLDSAKIEIRRTDRGVAG